MSLIGQRRNRTRTVLRFNGGIKLELVTFLIPEAYLMGLHKLVEEDLYPSRSAAVRFAVQDLLRRELWRQVGILKEKYA